MDLTSAYIYFLKSGKIINLWFGLIFCINFLWSIYKAFKNSFNFFVDKKLGY